MKSHFDLDAVNRKQLLVNLCVGVSVVNIAFLPVWRVLVFASPVDQYWLPSFTSMTYLAVVINVWLIGALLGASAFVVRASRWEHLKTLSCLVFLALLVFPVSYLRVVLGIKVRYLYWAIDNLFFLGYS